MSDKVTTQVCYVNTHSEEIQRLAFLNKDLQLRKFQNNQVTESLRISLVVNNESPLRRESGSGPSLAWPSSPAVQHSLL